MNDLGESDHWIKPQTWMIKFQNYIQQTFLTHPIVHIIVFLSRLMLYFWLSKFNLNKLQACNFLMNCKKRSNTSVKIILNMSSMNEFAHVCDLLCSTYNTVTTGQHRNVFLFKCDYVDLFTLVTKTPNSHRKHALPVSMNSLNL